VHAFASRFRPSDYNPAWLLVGDRETAFSIDMTGDDTTVAPVITRLPPGLHVLENKPLGVASAKVDHVRGLLVGVDRLPEAQLLRRLRDVMSDHEIPEGYPAVLESGGEEIPLQVGAACVHTERHGTRWSGVVTVGSRPEDPPTVLYADGPPCRTSYTDAGAWWNGRACSLRSRAT
jgi:hypothetical protein